MTATTSDLTTVLSPTVPLTDHSSALMRALYSVEPIRWSALDEPEVSLLLDYFQDGDDIDEDTEETIENLERFLGHGPQAVALRTYTDETGRTMWAITVTDGDYSRMDQIEVTADQEEAHYRYETLVELRLRELDLEGWVYSDMEDCLAEVAGIGQILPPPPEQVQVATRWQDLDV